MANRFFGEVTAEAGGKTYTLRMDFNAMCEFEDATGKDAMETFAAMETGKASAKDLRAIIWASLREHHPDLTVKDAGAILSENVGALERLMQAIVPTADEAGEVGNGRKGKAA